MLELISLEQKAYMQQHTSNFISVLVNKKARVAPVEVQNKRQTSLISSLTLFSWCDHFLVAFCSAIDENDLLERENVSKDEKTKQRPSQGGNNIARQLVTYELEWGLAVTN